MRGRIAVIVCVLVGLMIVAIGYGYGMRKREDFEVVAANEVIRLKNKGSRPWNRHPIVSVPFLQMQPAFQAGTRHHANAAYYELDNHSYDIELKKAFSYRCDTRAGPWSAMEVSNNDSPKELIAVYPAMVRDVQKKICSVPRLANVQIVHDVWRGLQRHETTPKIYLVTIEAILYQQGKFQGKHVSLSIMADLTQNDPMFTVIQSHVEGVIAEDKIGLFPVVGQEHDVVGYDYLSVPTNPQAPYPVRLLDPETIDVVVNQQKQNLKRSADAALIHVI